MHAKRAKNPTWECCGCGCKIKYGESYTWWWMPNLVRCADCTAQLENMGSRYEQGVREKPVKLGAGLARTKKPIPGQAELFDV